MINRSQSRKVGFTLIEILVVLGIVALLGAILFPAFSRAQESARQSNCATNLNQIYFAVQQYFQDERAYPDSLVDLLPEGSKFVNELGVNAQIQPPAEGYLKSNEVLRCQNDDTEATTFSSSYGALTKNISAAYAPTTEKPSDYVWNFWGYNENGIAFRNATEANSDTPAGSLLLVAPKDDLGVDQGFKHESLGDSIKDDRDQNVLKFSLANRYAPARTIITHCIFHRVQTASDLDRPQDLTDNAIDAQKKNFARDIVLRLDGSARSVDVSSWKQNDLWRNQGN